MDTDIKKICELVGKLYLESNLKVEELTNQLVRVSQEKDKAIQLLEKLNESGR